MLRAQSPATWKKSHADNGTGRKPALLAGLLKIKCRGGVPTRSPTEARSPAVNLSWKAIHLGRVPQGRTTGSCKCSCRRKGLAGAGLLSSPPPLCSEQMLSLFRKPLERIKQIQPTLPSLPVRPGLFSHEDNETSTAGEGAGWGRGEALHKLVFSTPPHTTLLSTAPKKPPSGVRSFFIPVPSTMALGGDYKEKRGARERIPFSSQRGQHGLDCAKGLPRPLASTALWLLPRSFTEQLAPLYSEHFP